MKQYLSNRLERLSESQTLLMTKKCRELQSQGIDIINLSIGEPDFYTPDFVKQAAIDAINNNFTYYTPVSGIIELKKAIAEKLKSENNLSYLPSQILVSTGAKQSLANVILSLADHNQEVIIPAPYWVTYIELVKMANAVPVIIETSIENDYKVTPKQLESVITDNSKLFVFSSPCNPSGSLYSKEELAELVKVFVKYPNLFIISDEIYEYINYTGVNHASIAEFDEIKSRVIVVNGVSKGFAMTGWRIGYIAAEQWIVDACDKLQGQITSGTCSIAQKAATAAILKGRSEVSYMIDAFKKRKNITIEKLSNIKGLKTNDPKGAFYVFPDISYFIGKKYDDITINSSEDLAIYLLNYAHVATVSGDAFGNPDCIRFSYATSEEKIIEAIDRIKKALEKLV